MNAATMNKLLGDMPKNPLIRQLPYNAITFRWLFTFMIGGLTTFIEAMRAGAGKPQMFHDTVELLQTEWLNSRIVRLSDFLMKFCEQKGYATIGDYMDSPDFAVSMSHTGKVQELFAASDVIGTMPIDGLLDVIKEMYRDQFNGDLPQEVEQDIVLLLNTFDADFNEAKSVMLAAALEGGELA